MTRQRANRTGILSANQKAIEGRSLDPEGILHNLFAISSANKFRCTIRRKHIVIGTQEDLSAESSTQAAGSNWIMKKNGGFVEVYCFVGVPDGI